MLFSETIAVYSENHMNPVNTLREQNEELVNLKACSTDVFIPLCFKGVRSNRAWETGDAYVWQSSSTWMSFWAFPSVTTDLCIVPALSLLFNVSLKVSSLDQGSATFSLSRAALAIHIFVEGRRKKINSVVNSYRNYISLTWRV
jgi:hypothetical protein